MRPLLDELRSYAQAGVNSLSDEGKQTILSFLQRQWICPNAVNAGGFRGPVNSSHPFTLSAPLTPPDADIKPDLYYTLFGLLTAGALGWHIEPDCGRWLESVSTETNCSDLDFPHLCSLIASRSLCGLNRDCQLQQLFDRHQTENSLYAFECPAEKPSLYATFLAAVASPEITEAIEDQALWGFQKVNGFSNTPLDKAGCATTAAAICLLSRVQKNTETKEVNIESLRKLLVYESPYGGFMPFLPDATCDSTLGGVNMPHSTGYPDLLNTTTALVAIADSGQISRINKQAHLDFICGCWEDGFRVTPIEGIADVEYTAYGLIGLGCLQQNQ